jgi:excisionase family DNA binding protein
VSLAWRRGLGAFAAIAAKGAYVGETCVATSGRIRWPRCRPRVFWRALKNDTSVGQSSRVRLGRGYKGFRRSGYREASCRFVWLTGTANRHSDLLTSSANRRSALVLPEQEPMKPRGSRVPRHLTIVHRDPLLTAAAVAKWLGIAPRTVCLWAACKDIPAIKIGRQWRFRESELLEWLRNPERAKSNTT